MSEKKEMEINGRTIRLGLSVKNCIDSNILPSVFKPEMKSPIFDDWQFLLKIANMNIIKGEPFTENDGAWWVLSSAILTLLGGGGEKKGFLAQGSELGNPKLPSS